MSSASERVTREDLVTFLNACHACTGQREFYEAGAEQRLGIEFLHEYVLGNYRPLYERALERLPTQRAMHLFEELARRRVNNRRARAVVRDYLARARDPDFLAVKY